MRRILAIFLMIFSLSFAFALTSCDNVEVVTPTYTITFEVNGHGEKPEDITEVFAIPEQLPVLTAEGFTFEGWFADEEFKVKAVAGTKLSKNTTLYAKWTENVVDDPTSEEHTCEFSGEWKKDETHHWHECSCGKTDEKVAHTGGEATTEAKAVCEVCGQSYGELKQEPSHECDFTGEWESNATHHWHECECGEVDAEVAHSGGEATTEKLAECEVCGAKYGELLPPEHECDFTGEWKKDEIHHWHACSCGEIDEKVAHTGGEATTEAKAVCEVCGQSYGELKQPENPGTEEPNPDQPGTEDPNPDQPGTEDPNPDQPTLDPTIITVYFDLTWENVSNVKFNDTLMTEVNSEYGKYMVEIKVEQITSFKVLFIQPTVKEDKTINTEWHSSKEGLKEDNSDGKWELGYKLPCEMYAGHAYKISGVEWIHEWDTGEHKWFKCTVTQVAIDKTVCTFGTEWESDETNHWHECKCGEEGTKVAHTPLEAVKEKEVDSTCSKEGSYDLVVYCSECNRELSRETKSVDKLEHTPSEGVKENEKHSTCTQEGSYDLVVYCSVCEEEVSREAKTIAKAEHEYDETAWGYKGADGHAHKCKHCDAHDEVVAHTSSGEATETDAETCTVCAYVIAPATGHINHTPKAEWESDTTHHWHDCVGCSSEKIGYAEHTPAEAVKEKETKATCSAAGSYDSVVYCSDCGKELSREVVVVAQLPHTPNADDDNCSTAITCSVCGHVTTAAKEHNFTGDWKTSEKHHWHECLNEECSQIDEEVEHFGGEATLTEKAVCEACSLSYGELKQPDPDTVITVYVELDWVDITEIWLNGNKMSATTEQGCHYVTEFIQDSITSFELNFKQGDSWWHVTYKNPTEADKWNQSYKLECEMYAGHAYKISNINWSHKYDDYSNQWFTCTVTQVVTEKTVCTYGTEWKADATNHWHECRCGAADEKLAHTPAEAVKENEVATSCSKTGSYDSVVYCSDCNKELSRETVTVEKLAHTPAEAIKENEVATSCKAAGSYDSVVYCKVCNEEISRETVTVEKLAHTPAEAVIENEVEATCTKEGNYDLVVYCTLCSEELSREAKTVDKLDHEYDETTWGYKDETGHAHKCKHCDAHDEVVTHTSSGAATEDVAETCTVCDYVITPATGHITHTPKEEWKSDTTGHWHECIGCTTEKIGYEEHKEAAAVKENIKPATCSKEGSYESVVYCSVCSKELSRETVAVAKLAHTPSEDDNDCTTEVICSVCSEVVVEGKQHDFSGDLLSNEEGHYHECKNSGCEQTDGNKDHIANADDNNCATAVVCSECDYVITKAKSHNFTGTWQKDSDNHWHVCQNEGCTQIDTKVAHSGGSATTTAKAKCSICSQEYGSMVTKITIFFSAPPSYWGDKTYIHAWGTAGDMAGWSDTQMTFVETNSYGQKVFKYTIDFAKHQNVIFHNNNGWQTQDISLSNMKNNVQYWIRNNDGNIVDHS